MTAISPCPLATNITAIGFISRDIDDRKKVFLSGLIYTLGRAISYTRLALIIYFGANLMNISRMFQGWGEKLLAPVLIIIGLLMLDVVRLRFPGFSGLIGKIGNEGKGSYGNSLLLGIVFALAFCPASGVLYFTILIPITIASVNGLYLPVVFAAASGIPVIIFAWVLSYSVGSLGKLYNHVKIFELWFRRAAAALFIGAGIYYLIRLFVVN